MGDEPGIAQSRTEKETYRWHHGTFTLERMVLSSHDHDALDESNLFCAGEGFDGVPCRVEPVMVSQRVLS